MMQRRFKGTARPALFLLPAFARRRHPVTPLASADAPACERAQIRWANLLARLSHMAHRCAQADMIDQLKAFGVRRTRTVAIMLGRECDRAWREALANDFTLSRSQVQRHARELCARQPPDEDFRALADAYRQLLIMTHDASLRRWLGGRADVHDAQAKAMRHATWRGKARRH